MVPRVSKPIEHERCRIYPFEETYTWAGIAKETYSAPGAKSGAWCGVSRQMLFGGRGENGGFEVRYFEILPGGNSQFESHEHEHSILVLRGKGQIRFDDRYYDLKPLDTIYVAPKQKHQFVNRDHKATFGFVCTVNKSRDLGIAVEG